MCRLYTAHMLAHLNKHLYCPLLIAATGACCWQAPPSRIVWWSCGPWCTSSCPTSFSPTVSSKNGSPTHWRGWLREVRSTMKAWSRGFTRCWGLSCSGGSRLMWRSRCPRNMSMLCGVASPRDKDFSMMTSWLRPRKLIHAVLPWCIALGREVFLLFSLHALIKMGCKKCTKKNPPHNLTGPWTGASTKIEREMSVYHRTMLALAWCSLFLGPFVHCSSVSCLKDPGNSGQRSLHVCN